MRWVTLLVALAVTALLYGRTTGYGLDWDDYHFVRAYSTADVAHAWTGTWDASGIERPFYRPAAILFFAARSSIVGKSPTALHVVSLALSAAAAFLFAQWLIALELSPLAVLTGEILLLAHPWFPSSAAVWITNQLHLLELFLVFGALWLATARPDKWPWLVVIASIALLIKEDAIALAPAIALLWTFRRQPWRRGWILSTLGALLVYLAARSLALSSTSGYSTVAFGYLHNLGSGPLNVVLLTGARRDAIGALALACLLISAIAAGRERTWRLLLTTLGFLVLFDLPLVFITGPTRWQLLIPWVCFGAATCVDAVRSAGLRWRIAATVCLLIAGARFVSLNAVTTTSAAPCSAATREHDGDAMEWNPEAMDQDVRKRLLAKSALCGDGGVSGR